MIRDGAITSILSEPVCVRNTRDQGVRTVPGSFMRSEMPVAGFSLIEAGSLDEAIALVSKTPCAIADGVVEVWPLQE
jgi:hypothetical protein